MGAIVFKSKISMVGYALDPGTLKNIEIFAIFSFFFVFGNGKILIFAAHFGGEVVSNHRFINQF
jgi:hypothetical protein